ncbi:pyridoxamine 5'-phosphate oxidase [Pontibacter sp. BT310]|uniref:Pyridoxine/pyridoxamine 5'-phosphate oxidase n=1 Tax=Pontibacter populi TaxID=890055 RepID=A0ABS6XGA6_9BACT|nr:MULTISPECIES: pyridoxamine 5'-phosphate oxidase [Pontibacter]MBJ6120058.1 pyridoxamine 5'-phosphate oxidase [Pontibacter sp. BT310]MBR0572487.1 pyridoxamine 5'-phosphate oxidase [Microvirga sp. STS03]MBW3366911.1 pyridoxamine 5'-phosphate oxidase [Pontibacter populi]
MSLLPNIAAIRKNYAMESLSEASVAKDPITQFKSWMDETIAAEVNEPTAMVLSTVNSSGRPSARVVLLKDVTTDGFIFFTNYASRKGHDLQVNPFASFTFFWPELERQVRVEGTIKKVSAAISDSYFHSRPVGSQIGAWASPQSQPISSREELEAADADYTKRFGDLPVIPRPEHWGGYLLEPDRVEFWQGRPNRLHDRIVYELQENQWHIKRLAP